VSVGTWGSGRAGALILWFSLQMDVTSKESIIKVRDFIKAADGRLHILVNKLVTALSPLFLSRSQGATQCRSSGPHNRHIRRTPWGRRSSRR
jgi:hypothetical protein